MVRIGFAETYYDSVTGSQNSMLPLLTESDSFDAHLMVPDRGALATEAERAGVPVETVEFPPSLDRSGDDLLATDLASVARTTAAVARYQWDVFRHLRDRDYDALYCNSLKAVLLFGPPAKLLGVPILWYVRVDTPFPRLDAVASLLADHVITISDGTRDRLDGLAGVAADPTTIYTGVDLERFEPDADASGFPFSDRDGPVVLEVASILPRKGQHVLVDAVGQVSDQLGDFELVFAGEASDDAYKHGRRYREALDRRVERAGIEDRTTFLGWCDDVPTLLAAADVVVLPSFNEGLPRSLLEAFAAGVPVVATPAGGTEELVRDGHNGVVVPKGDPDSLADAVERLATDATLREEMGRRARRTVVESFSLESYVERFERYVARDIL